MNSLDTNILVYAADEDSAEHQTAAHVVDDMLANPGQWILADQVLFEFYRAIRNPRIFRHPLDAPGAATRIRFLREEIGVTRCCYELTDWTAIFDQLTHPTTPAQRTHDLILGCTLKNNGVRRFYTRNTKDFQTIGFPDLINPID